MAARSDSLRGSSRIPSPARNQPRGSMVSVMPLAPPLPPIWIVSSVFCEVVSVDSKVNGAPSIAPLHGQPDPRDGDPGAEVARAAGGRASAGGGQVPRFPG